MPKPITGAVRFVLPFLLCCVTSMLRAQDSANIVSVSPLSDKVYNALSKKSSQTEERLDRATDKYLAKLQKQEGILQKKLAKKDSLLAHSLFDGVEARYAALKEAPQTLSKYSSVYSGHLDSLTTALHFLDKANPSSSPELQKTLSQFSSLQRELDQAQTVKKFISERKQLLKENLQRLGMLRDFKGFQKEAYYYSAQISAYKAMWEDPDKLERKIMEKVAKLPQFKAFFQSNSGLASLFALPGSSNTTASLAGLQTRASVQASLTQRFGSGPNVQQLLQQNMQAAQGQLSQLKNKLASLGTGSFGNSSSDVDLWEDPSPGGGSRMGAPNNQKTRTLIQRLEYGVNIQSQKGSGYFPATSDIGLSLGYKLNDKSSIGIGVSYKLGLGRGWNHIRMSSEGIGLRSYVDYQIKGSLYLSGGYEQNYRTAFNTIQQLKDYSAWQSSGLLGLSKKYKVSKKLKGDMKLLWDFLSYQQVPRTQAILFRIGYSLK